MGKGERPKREQRKPKKDTASKVVVSAPATYATQDVEVVKKKRKPRDEDE